MAEGKSFAEVVRAGYLARLSFRVEEAKRWMENGLAMAPPSLENEFGKIVRELDTLFAKVEEMKNEKRS